MAKKLTDKTKFTRAELVSFGKYLLSTEREARINPESDKRDVYHADVENWAYEKEP